VFHVCLYIFCNICNFLSSVVGVVPSCVWSTCLLSVLWKWRCARRSHHNGSCSYVSRFQSTGPILLSVFAFGFWFRLLELIVFLLTSCVLSTEVLIVEKISAA
jgi:hypothetical protein